MKKLYYKILHNLHIKRYKYSAGNCRVCGVQIKIPYVLKVIYKKQYGFIYCRNGHKNKLN